MNPDHLRGVPAASGRVGLAVASGISAVGVFPNIPSPWIARFARWIPERATVLDYAGGAGRNLPPLAARGARVTLADRDPAALAQASAATDALETIEADLENAPWPFAGRRFDAVVCCNFLHRSRADLVAGLLNPGGLLIHETFALGNARYGRPANPDFLLRPGELARAAERAGLVVLAFEHGFVRTPKPALVQRVCAVRPPFDPERFPLDPGPGAA